MLRCSHILCKVDDIHTLVRDYRELGFTVAWASAPERAHNALVWFSEGPFLEFFELPPAARLLRWPVRAAFGAAAGERLLAWAKPGEGWRDVAVETDETVLAGTRALVRTAGVPTARVIRGGRTRPDGQRVRYQFLPTRPAGLPFVVSSYDPPQRPEEIVHPNGARGVARVSVGVAAADRAAFDALTGGDRWLAPTPAPRTGVLGVELRGLTGELDPARLHGAVLTPAAPEPNAEETRA